MEKLFLLEVLVENVEIDYSKVGIEKKVLDAAKQLCIKFQFLSFPELIICEEDFCQTEGDYHKSVINIKSGKSCLFSIRKWNIEDKSLPLNVTVLRQNVAPPHLVIGKASINLGSSFTNILAAAHSPENTATITKKCTDVYVLTNNQGADVGKIRMFVRLTCFGPLIVTQFQISGDENNSYLFRGNDASGVVTFNRNFSGDLYEKGGQEAYTKDPCETQGHEGWPPGAARMPHTSPGGTKDTRPPDCQPCPPTPPENRHEARPWSGQGDMQMQGTPSGGGYGGMQHGGVQGGMMPGGVHGGMGYGGMMPGGPNVGMFPGPAQGMMPGYNPGIYGSGQDVMKNQNKLDYKEFGAEVNGHSLSIKVLRKPKAPKKKSPPFVPFCGHIPICKESSSSSSEEENPPIPQQPGPQYCSCDYPLPPGFPPSGYPQATSVQKKKKKKKEKTKCPLQFQSGNYCLKPNCPMGYPTIPGMGSGSERPKATFPKTLEFKDGAPLRSIEQTIAAANKQIGLINDFKFKEKPVHSKNDEGLHNSGKPTFILNVPPTAFPVQDLEIDSPFKRKPKPQETSTQFVDKDVPMTEKLKFNTDKFMKNETASVEQSHKSGKSGKSGKGSKDGKKKKKK